MRSRLPLSLAALAASVLVADVAAAQAYFGRDNRTYASGTRTWSTQNAAGLAARDAFYGAGAISGVTGFEDVAQGSCAIVGAIGQCATGAALSGLDVAPGVTMTVTGDARTAAWGPIVTSQAFTYKDPKGPTYTTAGGSTLRDVDYGHYGVTADGLQDATGQYLRVTSLAGAPTTATLTFSRLLDGIGFWGIDANQPTSTVTIAGFNGSDQIFAFALDPKDYDTAWTQDGRAGATTNGNAFFFGYRGDVAFDRITITTSSGGSVDGWAIDNLAVSAVSTVPEPATVGLLAAGLLGLGGVGAARRRSRG